MTPPLGPSEGPEVRFNSLMQWHLTDKANETAAHSLAGLRQTGAAHAT